ncbi:protein EPD1 precursor [Delitschia confertaspora ATCC 74209]|uniref:1,3-beta-glucanosyltransferase n=1 Tax=Delitschia confertaspora ATCC 74209 TaxID=1513339 RepID=A0A9P4JK58_9PLEO|nr:protein EPD1 precursor [Delitschia confertaspora ATCC 74209]
MKSFTIAAAATALFASSVSAAVDPIVIKGSKFFYKTNGTQFFMKGVAYQQGVGTNTTQTENIDYTDPLADEAGCKRDIANLVKLNTNTIRVYAIDPTKNHDACMNALAAAGIYVVSDLSQPGESIIRDDPAWTSDLYARYTSVIDVMAKYDNTLGFFAGNEVSNQPNNTHASAFVKAAVRDMKKYIKQKNYRAIGVGYATNDDPDIREKMANFFDCGDREEGIDFWGYNIYSWCGDSSFKESGYDVRTKEFESYNVPVFFAEYGCNTIRPRKFTDVGTLYGKEMTSVWSGGIVYMYFEEKNGFGLVSVADDKAEPNADFTAYSSQIAKVTPSGVNMDNYNPTNTAGANCPSVGSGWAAQATPLPPTPNQQLCDCMYESLSCAVGSDVKPTDYKDLFGTVCGYKGEPCAGIGKNATTGKFGAYSMCSPKQQLGFAFNRYASQQSNFNEACNFKGAAVAQKAKASDSQSSQCKALLNEAGAEGTKTVTSQPTGTGTGNGGAASGSKSPGAAGALTVPTFETGYLQFGLYAFTAVLSGAAMVLL